MSYADLAFDYLRAGYSPLPLPPRAKKSPPEAYTGEGPMASGADVQEWIETSPDNANIALRVPPGVVVIDVDNHKHPAYETMMRAIEDLGPLPASGRSSARADDPVSGHRLYRIPEGVKLLGNLKSAGYGEGVDIIQHHHRYIVAPGSVHPDGGVYTWYAHPDLGTGFPAVDDLPDLPEAWVEALTRRAAPAVEFADDVSAYAELSESDRRRVDAYLETTLNALWAEMEDMKSWPESKTDRLGGWEDGMMARTIRLASLVAAPWCPLTKDVAMEGIAKHAPTGDDFTMPANLSKFVRALAKEDLTPAAMPAGGDDLEQWWDEVMASVPSVVPEITVDDVEVWPVRPWSERGFVDRTLEAAEGCLAYVTNVGWYEYHDGIWSNTSEKRTDDDVAAAWVSRARDAALEKELPKYDATEQVDAKGKAKEGSSEQDRFRKWLHSQGSNHDTAVARAMRRRARDFDLAVDAGRLDAAPYDLGVLNGVVDLRTGELRDAAKADFITKQSPVTYRPGAPRPVFERFLETSLPDPEVREYLQKVVGYSATGATEERAMFIHYGPRGSNGKSVLFNVLADVLGDHYGPASSKAILASRNEKSGQDFIDLIGPRFLALSETAEGSRLDDAEVKSLTGEDKRADRAHYSSNTAYRLTGKIHVSTNHLPHITPDESMKDRVHIIPWLESFAGREDLDLKSKLRGEREGILAWIVEGAAKWYAERVGTGAKLQKPLSAVEAVEKFFVGEDDVMRWRADRTIPIVGDAGWTPTQSLFDDYRRWMEAEGERHLKTRRQFSSRLADLLGAPSKNIRVDGRVMKGLPVKVDVANQSSTPWWD